MCQRATQLSPHTGAASWMHFRCEIRLYSSGLAWEEPVLDRWSSRAGAGHSLGGCLARDTRVHCGDGRRPGPAPLSGAPTSGWVSLGQGDLGTCHPCPAPFSSMEAGERLGKGWDGLTLVLWGLCDRRRARLDTFPCSAWSSQCIHNGMGSSRLLFWAALVLGRRCVRSIGPHLSSH